MGATAPVVGAGVVGVGLAHDLGLSVGDRLRLRVGAEEGTRAGVASGRRADREADDETSVAYTVSGLLDVGNADLNERWVFVSLRVAQALFGLEGGASTIQVKVTEIFDFEGDGAAEVDMVINLGAALAGDWAAVEADIAAVRAAAPAPVVLKVIIESAALDDQQIVAACRASESAGADFVKTSTGFHPAGGASERAVRAMHRAVGGVVIGRGLGTVAGLCDRESGVARVPAARIECTDRAIAPLAWRCRRAGQSVVRAPEGARTLGCSS